MNKIFFQLLHNRALRLFGYDPYLNRGPDDPTLPLPVITSFTARPTTITSEPDSISQLRWTVTGATQITINQGVGDVSSVLGANVKPSSTTTYTMTATNASGSVQRSVRVSVSSATETLVADAVASNLSPTAGQSVTFTGSATGGTGGYSYAWSFSDGQGAASTRITSRSFAAAGTYAATLTVTSGGETATEVVEVSVNSGSSAPVVTITHSPASPVVGEEVTYVAAVSQGTPPYSYNWQFGDGTSGGNLYYARKTYRETGTKNTTLTVVGGATTTAAYRISVSASVPTPNPDLDLYEVDPNFDPVKAYPNAMDRNMAQAFAEVVALGDKTLRPELDEDSILSSSRDDMVDLYRMRRLKIVLNLVRGILSHKPDNRLPALLLPFVKQALDGLVTDWTTYPYADTPGSVNSSGVVIDRHANDRGKQRWNGYTDKERDNRNGDGRTVKDAYARWVAWGRSTSRQSPRYRNDKSRSEKPQYKKLLYLNAHADASGIANYGTHLHTLDNIMAHVTLGWACYILDVNRAMNKDFEDYGQRGYNYFFNHWIPLLEQTLADRITDNDHPAKDCYDIRKALYHNHGAQVNLYALLVQWRKMRGQTPDPRDERALKKMLGFMIDGFHFFNLPSGLFEDSSNQQFGNWAHQNNPYKVAIKLGSHPYTDPGQAVTGYDREFGGELYNLYRMGIKDDKNRTITRSLVSKLANTYAFIVYPKQTGNTFSKEVAFGVAGGGDKENVRYAFFNDGDKRVNGDWNGSKVRTQFGTADGAVYRDKGARYRDALMGGWYMWADATPGLKATRNWMRRARHCADDAYRLIPDHFLNTANPEKKKAWQWLGIYLLIRLENPNRKITELDLSF